MMRSTIEVEKGYLKGSVSHKQGWVRGSPLCRTHDYIKVITTLLLRMLPAEVGAEQLKTKRILNNRNINDPLYNH